ADPRQGDAVPRNDAQPERPDALPDRRLGAERGRASPRRGPPGRLAPPCVRFARGRLPPVRAVPRASRASRRTRGRAAAVDLHGDHGQGPGGRGMNVFLPERFVEHVDRLALGLEPRDAVSRLRPARLVDIAVDGPPQLAADAPAWPEPNAVAGRP